MKVLFVASDNNHSSGAFLSMVALNRLLKERHGIETLVILPKEGTGAPLLEENGIPYRIVESRDWVIPEQEYGTLKAALRKLKRSFVNIGVPEKIAKIAAREGVDLIHINTTYAYVGMLAAQCAKLPCVWHLREMLEEDQGRTIWNREAGYSLIGQADKVVAISNCVYRKYEKLVNPSHLTMIFNGIDLQQFYCPEHTILTDDEQKVHLIYGGGYARRKGVYELGSALALLLRFGVTNFDIRFIGEPNEKYKEWIEQNGLTPYVIYLGYQKDVSQWYAKADIAFSTSACEAFGRKTVEAMLGGTAMIAADTGGTLDLIEDGKTGLVYRQGDPADLAFKIIYAISHKEEMRQIAANGRDFAYRNFGAEKNADEIANLYHSILYQ